MENSSSFIAVLNFKIKKLEWPEILSSLLPLSQNGFFIGQEYNRKMMAGHNVDFARSLPYSLSIWCLFPWTGGLLYVWQPSKACRWSLIFKADIIRNLITIWSSGFLSPIAAVSQIIKITAWKQVPMSLDYLVQPKSKRFHSDSLAGLQLCF